MRYPQIYITLQKFLIASLLSSFPPHSLPDCRSCMLGSANVAVYPFSRTINLLVAPCGPCRGLTGSREHTEAHGRPSSMRTLITNPCLKLNVTVTMPGSFDVCISVQAKVSNPGADGSDLLPRKRRISKTAYPTLLITTTKHINFANVLFGYSLSQEHWRGFGRI